MVKIIEVLEQMRKVDCLGTELKEQEQNLINSCNQLDFCDIKSLDYYTLKLIVKKVGFRVNKNTQRILEDMLLRKKIFRYPQLLKPTYFPEIDSLDISDDEKLRLDKAARNSTRYILKAGNVDKTELSINDLELLTSIGVAEKEYEFKCKCCGDGKTYLTEKELENYRRIWKLKELKNRSYEQEQELSLLYDDEDLCESICIYCEDKDSYTEFTISNEEELDDYKEYIEEYYRIVKVPNLEYEKL